MQVQTNYLLAQITTMQVGGKADYFEVVETSDQVKAALKFAQEKSLAVLVLGNGSNVVVSDDGFRGLVIQNKIRGLDVDDGGVMKVAAGENWDDVVRLATDRELAGIECLSGVPGSAGGAVVQNIGAYGQTLGDLVTQVETIETATGQEKIFSASECEFGYRTSRFKKNPNQYIVIGFQMKLQPAGKPSINYPHVAKHFEGKSSPSLSEVREFIIRLRGSKGYLIMPGYERYNTAGSYFKNPIVNGEQLAKLQPILGDPSLNRFWPNESGAKIAAAYLLQEAGFAKGYREGNVGISPKHSLSLVNFGGAKAAEIKALANKIKSVILEKFGVQLEEEILYIGEFHV